MKHTGKKAKRDRKLKLPLETELVFREYVSVYHLTDKLFPYTSRFVESLISDVVQAIRGTKESDCQYLRDMYAVRCLKWGEDIQVVLKKLGL